MILYGTRLYGKTDETSSGYVATRFFHIWFVPLIPLSSWFVAGEEDLRPLAFSVRSVLLAYVRAIGAVAALLGGALFSWFLLSGFQSDLRIYMDGGSSVTEDEIIRDAVTLGALGTVAALGVFLFVLSRFFRKAGAGRCAALEEATGLPMSPL